MFRALRSGKAPETAVSFELLFVDQGLRLRDHSKGKGSERVEDPVLVLSLPRYHKQMMASKGMKPDKLGHKQSSEADSTNASICETLTLQLHSFELLGVGQGWGSFYSWSVETICLCVTLHRTGNRARDRMFG